MLSVTLPIALFGFITIGIIAVWAVINDRRNKNLELHKQALEELAYTRQSEINRLRETLRSTNSTLTKAKDQLPQTWLEMAANDLLVGKGERAVQHLTEGLNTACEYFSDVCVQLAEHHASSMEVSDTPDILWRDAQRLAEVAARLTPESPYAGTLAGELAALGPPPWSLESGLDVTPSSNGFMFRGHGLETRQIVSHLATRSRSNLNSGRYVLAKLLAKRARMIGRRELGDNAPETFHAQVAYSYSLDCLGEYGAALDEIQVLLPLYEKVHGAEHPNTLSAQFLRAYILNSLGEYGSALDEVHVLLPQFEKMHGAEHPYTLSARYLHAQILNSLGQYGSALYEVLELLPLYGRVRGTEHPCALMPRSLNAQILDSLGEYDAALDEVQSLLPLYEKVRGTEHPYALRTRYLECRIQHHMCGDKIAIRMALEKVAAKQQLIYRPIHKNLLDAEQLLLELQ